MGKRNYLSKSNKSWSYPNWVKNCPEFEFKVINNPNKFPDFVPKPLLDKYNAGYLASSGSTMIIDGQQRDLYLGFFVGLRIDGLNIDEQPYVSVFDKLNGNLIFDGYLQHGSYDNRTTALTEEQIELINKSGITTELKTNRLPEIMQGRISFLAENNIIGGISASAVKAIEGIKDKSKDLS